MNPRQDIEREIIGSVLSDERALDALFGELSVSDLSSTRCRKIFSTILEQHAAGLPFDLMSIKAVLESRGELDEAGGAAYLGSLIADTPLNGNLGSAVKMLKELPWPIDNELPDPADER